MSHEVEIATALMAHAPLVTMVGQRICLDEVPADEPKPYVVYSKGPVRYERGLDNSIHSTTSRFEIQAVGQTRTQSLELRELVEAALLAANQPPIDMEAGYDPDNDAEVETVSVDWWT